MPDATIWLRTLAPRLDALGPDGVRLHGAIEAWLDGESFEAALDLPSTWRQDAARQARDEALRDIALRHFAGTKVRPQAKAILTAAHRLQSTGADLAHVVAVGGLKGDLARVLLLTSEGHLRRILKSYAVYCNEARVHLSPDKAAPTGRSIKPFGRITALSIRNE